MADQVSRRGFIQKTAIGAAGILALPVTEKALGKSVLAPFEKSRVVVVKHDNAYTGTTFNQDVIQIMMDNGITSLTGIGDVAEAWKSLFPGITSSSVIGIKINCLFSRQCTHPPVTNTVLNGLKRMIVDGSPFPENKIIVWDMGDGYLQQCGYTINRTSTGVRFMGTTGYGTVSYPVDGGTAQRLSRFIAETCDFLINLSVLKNHSTGVSLSMKNHYGSINNVNGAGMHNYPCRTQLPSLNAAAPIRQKQVICICDAIRGVISGGPDNLPQVTPKSLILSRDTVAHDYTGAKMLEDYGCRTASLTGTACHVAAAAQAPYNLGTCDPAQIERIDINNPIAIPSGVNAPSTSSQPVESFALIHNYPNPFNGQTVISYRMEKTATVHISVVNTNGQVVRKLLDKRQGPGSFQIPWDGSQDNGERAASGNYFCVLESGQVRKTIKMQLIQ